MLCDKLVFGLNADSEIIINKGPPVMNNEERMKVVNACKWTDEVHAETDYFVSEKVLDQFKCDFYLHGDDPCYNTEGVDMCQELSKVGKFKVFKRTSGVSTTGLTAKLLRLFDSEDVKQARRKEIPKQQFLQTSSKIAYFSNQREPLPTDTIVYMAGSLDLMHPGWIDRIKLAKEQGDFLYVGIWDDEMTRFYRGNDFPIQPLQERVLETLACKYVDEVIIGAPFILTKDLITTLNISKVVVFDTAEDSLMPEHKGVDAYEIARQMNLLVEMPPIENELTLEILASRVLDQKAEFEKKVLRKTTSENKYYDEKQTGLAEVSPVKTA